jgi:hypothetical protein
MTAAAALCAAATITIGTLTPAGGDEGRKVHFVDSSPITPANFISAFPADTSRCTFNGTLTNVVAPCVTPVTPTEPKGTDGVYDDTLTGDVAGTGDFEGGGVLAVTNDFSTLDVPFEAYEPVSVQVADCGTGTFVLRNEGNLDTGNGVWQIVPNSGRGGLLGISGGGTYSAGTTKPNGTTPSLYVGRVRCNGNRDE